MIQLPFRCTSIVLLSAAVAEAQTTARVSLDTAGGQGNASSYYSSISADGRFVAFSSEATNLVPGDGNHQRDVFVRDRQNGSTVRASVDTSGLDANDWSARYTPPSLSADGRFVAFDSYATNLVAGDVNGLYDAFVRDLVAGTTVMASVTASGVSGNGESYAPRLSTSGRFVTFLSTSSDLVPNDSNGPTVYDVFVRDLQMGTTTLASVSTAGTQANGSCYSPSISADGRYVAFYSYATNLAAVGTTVWTQVYLRDLQAGTTVLVSATPAGAAGQSSSFNCLVSAGGRFVVFESWANDLVAGDTNYAKDVFVRDVQSSTTVRANLAWTGLQAHGDCSIYCDAISADGRFVVFQSRADDIVAGDTNARSDVFLRDLQSQTTLRVSLSAAGAQGDGDSDAASVSSDGRFVAFESVAQSLVPGDTNASWDVFVRDLGVAPVSYCFGDGSGTPCPCGNAGQSGHGCASSAQPAGAQLSAVGTSSVTNDMLALQGTSMPAGSSALYFQGTTQVLGGNGAVFGDGLRCVGGNVIRLGVEINSAAGSVYPSAGDSPISTRGAIPTGGGTRTYQSWYRNSSGPCASGFNLTNGVRIVWTP